MSEKTRIENPKLPLRLRKIAAYLVSLAVVGGLMYGAVKYGEAVTKHPKKAPLAKPATPAAKQPRPNYDKMYVAHQGEDAESIVMLTYPNLDPQSPKFVRLRNMVNNQISRWDEYNKEHPGERTVPLGQSGAIQLTKEAQIPEENTEAYYAGDYEYAKKIANK